MANFIFLKETNSTNTYLKTRCKELCDGTVVSAEIQTAGRGRLGHGWSANEGMLPFSILLKNPIERETLTARAGLAICGVIADFCGNSPEIGIKWPNDIIIANRKVCGILCESLCFGDSVCVICGVGINISQSADYFLSENLPNAGSLLTQTGIAPDREELLRNAAERIILRAKQPFSECRGEYRKRLVNLGKKVRIISQNSEIEATAEDISANGFLVCRGENGIFEVGSGEVSVRGENGYI